MKIENFNAYVVDTARRWKYRTYKPVSMKTKIIDQTNNIQISARDVEIQIEMIETIHQPQNIVTYWPSVKPIAIVVLRPKGTAWTFCQNQKHQSQTMKRHTMMAKLRPRMDIIESFLGSSCL